MTAEPNRFVTLEYKFFSPDGTLLGSSQYHGPLVFQVGVGEVIDGLDRRILGHEEGEELVFVVPAAEAYGERDESLVTQRTLDELGLVTASVGDRVQVKIDDRWYNAYITELNGSVATVDANHPLAGVPLHFECSLVQVSETPPVSSCCSGGCGGCGGGCGS